MVHSLLCGGDGDGDSGSGGGISGRCSVFRSITWKNWNNREVNVQTRIYNILRILRIIYFAY